MKKIRKLLRYIGEDRTIRYNILMIVITVIVVSITASALYKSLTKDDQRKTTELLFNGVYNSIESEFLGPIQVSMTMSADPMLLELIDSRDELGSQEFENRIAGYLDAISTVNNWSNAFFVLDETKGYYRGDGYVKRLSEANGLVDRWYFAFVESGMDVATDVNTDEFNENAWTIFIDKRVEKDGEFIGVCGVGFVMDDVINMLKAYEQTYGVSLFFVDTDGNVVVNSSNANLETTISVDVTAVENQEEAYWVDDGYVMTRYIDELGWYLVVENNQNSFSIVLRRLAQYAALIVIMLVILIIIFNYALSMDEHKKLNQKATTDPLTGIPNRAGLTEKIEEFMAKPGCKELGATLYVLDLDHFKDVNDTLGHATGDKVLVDVAGLLMKTFRANDIVGRIGGDEFVAFCPGLNAKETIVMRANQLNESGRMTYSDERGNSVAITMSIGSAKFPEHGQSYEELFRNADQALYFVKNTTRDGYKDFSSIPSVKN